MCNQEVLGWFVNLPLLLLFGHLPVLETSGVLRKSKSLFLKDRGCLAQSCKSKGI